MFITTKMVFDAFNILDAGSPVAHSITELETQLQINGDMSARQMLVSRLMVLVTDKKLKQIGNPVDPILCLYLKLK